MALPNDPDLVRQLADAAEQAITATLERGGRRTPRPAGEVSAVRTLTLDGFDEVAHAWEPILRPIFFRIELTAIFTHSRPHVTFTPTRYVKGTGRCELADLLIVVDHQRYDGSIDERRAALVQAKKLKSGRIRLSGSDWTQHELLLDLPAFRFVEPIYGNQWRDLGALPVVGAPEMTAEYGGVEVDRTPKNWQFWLPSGPKPSPVASRIPIGQWLARVAAGIDGCGRDASPTGSDAWSVLVEELLQVTGALPIVQRNTTELRRNSNVVGRVRDHAAYLGVTPGLSAGGGPRKPDDEEYWPEGPISVVQLSFRQIG